MKESELLEEVKTGLSRAKGHWPAIAHDLGVSYWWLSKVANGHIRNPGVIEVERLNRYLNGHFPKGK